LKRRQLLATIGATAVAGCGGDQQSEPATEIEAKETESTVVQQQTDCVDSETYEQLRADYQQLRREHQNLRDEHRRLQERHADLQERMQTAQFPPYIVTDRRSISVTYETLGEETESWEWDSSALESQITWGSIARRLTYQQLEYLGLDVFGFEGNSKYRQLGNYGQYYQLNPFTIPSNFGPLADRLYNRHETDQRRIRAAWNFVTQLNDYVRDIGETPRFPLETLLMGGGDCEDSAILLGSILYSMAPEWDVTFWYIDAENPTDPRNINHVILSVDTERGERLIETTSNTAMTPFDEVNGFSVEISPTEQATQSKIGSLSGFMTS
jgi:hypothetical protein